MHRWRVVFDWSDRAKELFMGKQNWKRTPRQTGLLAALFLIAGCSGPQGGDGGAGKPAPQPGQPARTRVALVLDQGGVDDRSFNAAAWEGLQRAMKEYPVDGKYIESKQPADYKVNLTAFASQKYDLVVAVGFNMEDALKEVAAQFPAVKFAIVDGRVPEGATNCAALQFKEEQGTFLAGYLAGAMSKTRTVGFVGGMDIPLIKKFEAGYRAGVRTANPAVQVLNTYTGDWDDLTRGRSQAAQQFGNGADIVFHAAGKAGLGVIEAAREKGAGFYAIGVDKDQDGEAPGRVLTSMVKRVDTAVYDTVKRTVEGTFQPGVQVYDLKAGGVALTEMKYTKKDIPPAVLANLEKLTRMVAEGQITPPSTIEGLTGFTPPKL